MNLPWRLGNDDEIFWQQLPGGPLTGSLSAHHSIVGHKGNNSRYLLKAAQTLNFLRKNINNSFQYMVVAFSLWGPFTNMVLL